MGFEDVELSVLITNDREISKLNQRYRGKDKATDVLSFPVSDKRPEILSLGIMGDVVISLTTAIRQARDYDRSVSDEMLRLLIHGVLHLIGYEHERVSAVVARRMRQKEQKLFLKLHKLM